MDYKCPKCGSTHWSLLSILNFNDPAPKEVRCNECDYAGTMLEFSGEEQQPATGGGEGG